MNVANLKVSMQITLADGGLAEVLEVMAADAKVKIRYIDPLGSPELTGTEAVVTSDEVIAAMDGTHTEGLA